jgi:hypothetical protein
VGEKNIHLNFTVFLTHNSVRHCKNQDPQYKSLLSQCYPYWSPQYYKQGSAENYWVSGLCPLSGILNTRKIKVLETGSVSVLR